MARTIISVSSAITSQGSGPIAIDVANGHHVDLSNPSIAPLLEKYGLHLIVNNTGGSGSIILRAGYGPFAPNMSQGDLTLAIGAASVSDIGSQVSLLRHSKDAFGSFDIDYVGLAGSIMLVISNAAPIPANSAGNSIIKTSPGWLLASVITTVGTAALSTYDHQGASAGPLLHNVPGSAAQGTMYTPAQRAQNGITCAGAASGPGLTVFYT